MAAPGTQPVTMLLQSWRRGDSSALNKVAEIVERELRRLASSYLRHESPGHTLQPTALVNEAFLRLIGQGDRIDWESRSHFIGIAARYMRQVLVDHARSRHRAKRGGIRKREPLDERMAVTDDRLDELVAIDRALRTLESVDARKAKLVELRYFGGLTVREISEQVGISERTAFRELGTAEAWLGRALQGL